MTRWVVGLALLAGACGSCAPRIPMTLRPDTRRVWYVTVDSTAFPQTMAILQAALPKEAALCYTGRLADTLTDHGEGLVLHLTAVQEAVEDSSDTFHVYFDHADAGCDHAAIAVAHSHPYDDACRHSDDDARLLFENPRHLVSIIWCGNGLWETLFQDGRRDVARWRP